MASTFGICKTPIRHSSDRSLMSFLFDKRKSNPIPSEGRRKSNPSNDVTTSIRTLGTPERIPLRFAFLHKDGGFQKLYWDKRYFVLWSNGELEYYKNVTPPQNEKELAELDKGEFKGGINVLQCQIKPGKPRSKKDHVLELTLAERTFFIGFDTSIDMLVWEGAMRQVAFKIESKKTPDQRRSERKNRNRTSIKRNKEEDQQETTPEDVQSLQAQLETCKTEVSRLTEDNKSIQSAKDHLELQCSKKDDDLKALKEKLARMEVVAKDFESSQKNLESTILDIEMSHLGDDENVQKELQEQIDKYNDLQTKSLSSSIEQDLITALQTSERDLTEKLRNLRDKNAELSKSLISKTTTVTTLTDAVSALQLDLQSHMSKENNLTLQVEGLQKENLDLKEKIATQMKRMEALEQGSKQEVKPITSKIGLLLDRLSKNEPKTIDANVSNLNLSSEEFKALCVVLINNTVCKRLDISNNKLLTGKGWIEEFCNLLEKNKTLEDVILDGCPVDREGVKKIIESLHKNYTMMQFTCGSNETDADINEIEDLLDRNYEKSKK
jgi:predicted  nucleic acid-binding Zn-ribbon protein